MEIQIVFIILLFICIVSMKKNNSLYLLPVSEKLNLTQYSYLVTNIIDKLNIDIPSGLNKDNLLSYGLNGLHKAMLSYDKNKGSFNMYAKCKIYNEIIDNIRTYSPII